MEQLTRRESGLVLAPESRVRVAHHSGFEPAEWTPRSALAPCDRVVRIASEGHLRELLDADRDSQVTVLGAGYSRARVLRSTSGLLLDLTGMSGLVRLDAETATFRAGTRLEMVHTLLRALGRRMACSPGVIAAQTLAGAIGTGTHGQGMAQSTLSDAVESVRFVARNGDLHVVRRGDPAFAALQLHLGLLGVVTELEVCTAPSTVHTCEKLAVGEDDFLDGFVHWNEQYEFCKAWWFPKERKAHVWRVREASSPERERFHLGGDRLVEITKKNCDLNKTIQATIGTMRRHTRTTDLTRDHFRTVTRFMDFQDATGDLYELLCKGIPAPQVNLEVAVPFTRFHQAQEMLRRWYDRRHPELHYPVILRATGPSEAWLSPAHGTSSCYFGFVVYQAVDGSFPSEAMCALREAEELLAEQGGRPHWGKHFTPELYNFPAQYQRWDDFLGVMRSVDPDGRFGSDFTRALLSPASA